MKTKGYRYSQEQKTSIIELANSIGKKEAAEQSGVSLNTLSKWCKPKEVVKVFNRSEEAIFKIAIKNEEIQTKIYELVRLSPDIKEQVIDFYMTILQAA